MGSPPALPETRRHFPGAPEQVGAARRYVRARLPARHPRHDAILLCLSEAATNALRHSDFPELGMQVEVEVSDEQVRVTVYDGGGRSVPGIPEQAGQERTDGRGMFIIAVTADAWGFRRHENGGTEVWFILRTRPAPLDPKR